MGSSIEELFRTVPCGPVEASRPFANRLDPSGGILARATSVVERRLGDLEAVFADRAAWQAAVAAGDPLVYQVAEIRVPEEEGHLLHCVTALQPGRVGREYYATKGHYHAKRATAEIYLCLAGEGFLLMQDERGHEEALPMTRGALNYIPPCFAHRTVNTGASPLVFLSVWPADSGHDYETIARGGFRIGVEEEGGRPRVVRRVAARGRA